MSDREGTEDINAYHPENQTEDPPLTPPDVTDEIKVAIRAYKLLDSIAGKSTTAKVAAVAKELNLTPQALRTLLETYPKEDPRLLDVELAAAELAMSESKLKTSPEIDSAVVSVAHAVIAKAGEGEDMSQAELVQAILGQPGLSYVTAQQIFEILAKKVKDTTIKFSNRKFTIAEDPRSEQVKQAIAALIRSNGNRHDAARTLRISMEELNALLGEADDADLADVPFFQGKPARDGERRKPTVSITPPKIGDPDAQRREIALRSGMGETNSQIANALGITPSKVAEMLIQSAIDPSTHSGIILAGLRGGESVEDIARKLGLSPENVEKWIKDNLEGES